MKNEIIFSVLENYVSEKDHISAAFTPDKWKSTEYKTGLCAGKMLLSPETVFPQDITLDLNLKGAYRIYVCVPLLRSENYVYVKLSDEMCFSGIRASRRRPTDWGEESFFDEFYWQTADLTDKKLIISRPESNFDSVSAVAWIRCVPVDESELSKEIPNKCVQMHIDGDGFGEDSAKCEDDYLIRLYPMRRSNAKFVSYEISFNHDQLKDPKTVRISRKNQRMDKGTYEFNPHRDSVYKKAVKLAHENGVEIYATNRMEVGNFVFPYTTHGWNCNFVNDNPQFHCKTRNGVTVNACSYAYSEVQDYVINRFIEAVKCGFDGITLIYHRGIHIGFEQPVLDRFSELYPDVDPHLLPFSDERLHGVLCGFMNEFMHKLRNALDQSFDRHIKINTITDFGLETSKNLGLDVEYWAKNGLVDSVSQADMETFEDLEGCMSDENPQLIDISKYNKELEKRAVIRRHYGTDVDKVCAHIPEYVALKKYGVEAYHVLPWMRSIPHTEYAAVVERMKKAGAENFLSWNTNHIVWNLPEFHTIARIGNTPEDIEYLKFHRVLSIDGYDIGQFSPNWRG